MIEKTLEVLQSKAGNPGKRSHIAQVERAFREVRAAIDVVLSPRQPNGMGEHLVGVNKVLAACKGVIGDESSIPHIEQAKASLGADMGVKCEYAVATDRLYTTSPKHPTFKASSVGGTTILEELDRIAVQLRDPRCTADEYLNRSLSALTAMGEIIRSKEGKTPGYFSNVGRVDEALGRLRADFEKAVSNALKIFEKHPLDWTATDTKIIKFVTGIGKKCSKIQGDVNPQQNKYAKKTAGNLNEIARLFETLEQFDLGSGVPSSAPSSTASGSSAPTKSTETTTVPSGRDSPTGPAVPSDSASANVLSQLKFTAQIQNNPGLASALNALHAAATQRQTIHSPESVIVSLIERLGVNRPGSSDTASSEILESLRDNLNRGDLDKTPEGKAVLRFLEADTKIGSFNVSRVTPPTTRQEEAIKKSAANRELLEKFPEPQGIGQQVVRIGWNNGDPLTLHLQGIKNDVPGLPMSIADMYNNKLLANPASRDQIYFDVRAFSTLLVNGTVDASKMSAAEKDALVNMAWYLLHGETTRL